MGSLPRRRLWKRRYSSFLTGEASRPDSSTEIQRVTLYLDGNLFDLAEKLTVRERVESIQKYCERLLSTALLNEKSRHQIEDAEARHGTLEGLREIADDPDFLAELSATKNPGKMKYTPPEEEGVTHDVEFVTVPIVSLPAPDESALSPAAMTVFRHAGFVAADQSGFLPTLRRGETPSVGDFEELAQALVDLDQSLASDEAINRPLAHALHRLAFESQVLHTDAWPNAFDAWTVDAIRAIQGAVDRLLSYSISDDATA